MATGARARSRNVPWLVFEAGWLARDLTDVLLKVAAGHEPPAVMRSDLPRRIQDAETRLELLREMSR